MGGCCAGLVPRLFGGRDLAGCWLVRQSGPAPEPGFWVLATCSLLILGYTKRLVLRLERVSWPKVSCGPERSLGSLWHRCWRATFAAGTSAGEISGNRHSVLAPVPSIVPTVMVVPRDSSWTVRAATWSDDEPARSFDACADWRCIRCAGTSVVAVVGVAERRVGGRAAGVLLGQYGQRGRLQVGMLLIGVVKRQACGRGAMRVWQMSRSHGRWLESIVMVRVVRRISATIAVAGVGRRLSPRC